MTFKCTFINNSYILRNFERRGEDTILGTRPDTTMTTIFAIELGGRGRRSNKRYKT